MASAMAIARKRAPCFLLPCRGSWHAPAPARYRFAIQSAESRLPLPPPIPSGLHDARRGGGRWAAWAWAGVAYSSLPGGDKDGDPRLWRALHDIKAFAQRQERLADGLAKNVGVMLAEQSKLTQLVLDSLNLKATNGTRVSTYVYIFFVGAGLLGWSYTRGTDQGKKKIDEFLSDHLSEIISDPKVQRSIQTSATTWMRTVNPYYWLKDWMYGVQEDTANATRPELVSRITSLVILVLAILRTDTEITEGVLIGDLNRMGMTEDYLIKKALEILVKSGYIAKSIVKGPKGEEARYAGIDMHDWAQDLISGQMQVKIKEALGWKWWNSITGFR